MVRLLQPSAAFSNLVLAGDAWTARRDDHGQPFYAAMQEGAYRLAIDGETDVVLPADDFVLIPAGAFDASSLVAPSVGRAPLPVEVGPGVFRLGPPEVPRDLRRLMGHFSLPVPFRRDVGLRTRQKRNPAVMIDRAPKLRRAKRWRQRNR